ncbi:MAG: CCA tRNA nucleotidyltransferase [Planctomycetota bacterium]
MNELIDYTDQSFAISVVRSLREAGYETLFAGGCVRDLLMGNTPADYDVATSATPDQVRQLFGRKRTVAVGAAFGVMIVLAPRKAGQVEVATFRTDASYSDGRRPDSVTFSTPEEDAQRRDFTINGMFYDPIEDCVIDFVQGQEDLRKGVIRAIGDPADRIAEDKLRMLRAVRFAARFRFAIDPTTREAIAKSAPQVGIVSGERIAVEVQKTLQTNQSAWAIDEWSQLGLLSTLFPEAGASWQAGNNSVRSLVSELLAEDWHSKVAALMYASNCVQAEDWNRLKQRFKMSNSDIGQIEFSASHQQQLDNAEELSWSVLQPMIVHEFWPAALALFRARCEVKFCQRKVQLLEERIAAKPELDPRPLLLGQDLIAVGLKPGPRFKALLQEIRDLQLDGKLADKRQALDWLGRQNV